MAALIALVLGCGASPEPASYPTTAPDVGTAGPTAASAAGSSASTTPPATSSAMGAARCVGTWWGKPPLKSHFFDVTLQNPADGPRWLILPETFPYEGARDPYPGQGSLAELQVYLLVHTPRVVIGKAVSTGSFWAVRLPAGGTLTLRKLPIDSFWENVPEVIDLEIIVAREVTVGAQSLSTCFGAPSLSETGADVKAPRDAGDPRALAFWHPADGQSVPVRFDEESRARLSVPLDCDTEM